MIELVTTWDALVNALGAAAMLAFGVWVLTLTPRTRSTKMLAVFAIAAGFVYIPTNLVRWSGWEQFAIWYPYKGAVWTVGGLALFGLAHSLLQPRDERARRLWRLAVGVAAFVPLAVLASLPFTPSFLQLEVWQRPPLAFSFAGGDVFFAAFLGLGLVLARRYRHPPEDRAETVRTQAVLVGAALVLWPAFRAGHVMGILPGASSDLFPSLGIFALGLFSGFLVLGALWLVNTGAVPERSAEGRNLALLVFGMLLLGVIQGVFINPLFSLPAAGPLWGVIRLATVLLLGYGILRHEILGIDAKFRWGVSKTTVAGIFVAVFFIVSEGAQVLFAGVVNNQLLGIIAAGALLFALAPIQRAADRIAEEVVPSGEPGAGPASDAEERYRADLRMALADGEITDEEEDRLAERAEQMGLGPKRVLELRREVEEEMDRDG